MGKHICKNTKQSSNPILPTLPYDLILEIFLKLLVKSLCRFKSVSKSLNASIKQPSFIKKYRPKTLIQWEAELVDPNLIDIYRVYQNGDATKLKRLDFDGGTLMEKLIPLPQWSCDFDFGYIPITNQFKVLGWKQFQEEFSCEFHILTLEREASWKKIENTLGITSFHYFPAVNVNEWLYWFDKHEERIISFNLVREEFGFVGLPREIDREEFKCSIFEFEGDLCLVEQPEFDKKGRCNLDIVNLWMLKDRVRSVWALMLKNGVIPLDGTELEYSYIGDRDACFVVCASGGEVMVLGADIDTAWIFSWNFLSGELRRIRVGDEQCCSNMSFVRKHVENHIDLKQFRLRRVKTKRTISLSAGSGGGIVSSSQPNSE